MKKHLAVSLERGDTNISTTLCGREHQDQDCETDNNVTEVRAEVTCKVCLRILANPKHWRYRKYLE